MSKPHTEKEIEELIENLWVESSPERKVKLRQFCLEQGWVSRYYRDFYLCDNPMCVSCRLWEDSINKKFSEIRRLRSLAEEE